MLAIKVSLDEAVVLTMIDIVYGYRMEFCFLPRRKNELLIRMLLL